MIGVGEFWRTNPQADRVDVRRVVVAEVGKCMQLTAECTEALKDRMLTSMQKKHWTLAVRLAGVRKKSNIC